MTPRPSPTMRRRQLAMELRRLREQANMTIEEVAPHLGRTSSTVSRIETGITVARPAHVKALLDLYGVPPEGPERGELLDLARDAQLKGWWSQYDDVLNTNLERYLGYECGAAGLRAYENRFVLGLLQTPGYCRAQLSAVRPYQDPDDLDQLVELRMTRQQVLTDPDPLVLWVVLDEAVLHRAIGGPEVMRAQLAHLLDLIQLPNVNLHVLPISRGGHAGLDGAFTIIEFTEPTDPYVVFVDGPAGSLFVERPKDVRRTSGVFNRLLSEAITGEESTDLIRTALGSLTSEVEDHPHDIP